MSSERRQTALYVYSVDIWRADAYSGPGDSVPFVKVATSVPCLFCSGLDLRHSTPAGRVSEERVYLMDWFAFDLDVDVRDADRLQLTAAPNGSPDVGRWFAVFGAPHRNAWMANRQRVVAKPSLSASP